MKSGIGAASMNVGGLVIGALMAVNAFGDVIDPQTGQIIAGARSTNPGSLKLGQDGYFGDTLEIMKTFKGRTVLSFATQANTVIGVVATNAKLTKSEATKVAQMAQDGIARAIRPAHTMLDGDTIFTLGTGEKKSDPSTVGAFAAEMVAQAILRAVQEAAPAGGLPGLKE